MSGSPRAVLWDLDGTLVDSGDYHWRAWRDTMRAEGMDLSYEQFLESFGQRNDRILTTWLGAGRDPAEIVRIGDAKEAMYRELARREGVAALPGARAWVERLHGEGWRQAIASSAPRANVEVMLAATGFDRLIEVIVSAEDVTRGKPDPDVFLAAASRLGVPPHHAVVVEDAAAGIEAARRGGMRSIGVNASARLEADVYVRSLVDLDANAFDRLVNASAASRSNP